MARRRALETHVKGSRRGSRLDDPQAYHAEGVLYLAPDARFEHLLALPEQAQVGKALNEAMKAVERDNPELGLPRPDNANYLWIQLFYSSLNARGRAGFIMANSASDARASEQDIRRKLIEAGAVDVMVAVGPNMFYTVTLSCTLWFLDRGKKGTRRADQVLFLDARHVYRQVDRAHRDWTPGQIGFLADVVRLYRGEEPDYTLGGNEAQEKVLELFGRNPKYSDVLGLCKVATLEEIEARGASLNPGGYVGVALGEEIDNDNFKERLEGLNEEFESLTARSHELELTIATNLAGLFAQ